MNCPICTNEMEQKQDDTSRHFETGDTYDRTIYHCAQDDAWVTVEVPSVDKNK